MTLAVRYGQPVIAFFGGHDVAWQPPPGVPVARTLADVESFVRGALAERLP
jgi:hypothetical protein